MSIFSVFCFTDVDIIAAVSGGVDCGIEIGRTGAKIILGEDHKVVKDFEDSTATKVYDTTMFLYGIATFDPKDASLGEKLLFIEDLAEKNLETYENINVIIDLSTGDVIKDAKKIAVEYTRIQSNDAEDLSKAAKDVLGEDKTGILDIDPTLDSTSKEQQEAFADNVDSNSNELKKAFDDVNDDDVTLDKKTEDFIKKCDDAIDSENKDDDGGGGGGGGGAKAAENTLKKQAPPPTNTE